MSVACTGPDCAICAMFDSPPKSVWDGVTTHLSWHPASDPAEVKRRPLEWVPLCWSRSRPVIITGGYAIHPDPRLVVCLECKLLYESGDFTGSLSKTTIAFHAAHGASDARG